MDCAARRQSPCRAPLGAEQEAVQQPQKSAAEVAALVGGQGDAQAMLAATVAISAFGLLLQPRRDYVTLRALGVQPAANRALIGAADAISANARCAVGLPVGRIVAHYLIKVLRPPFVLNPPFLLALGSVG